MQCLFRKPTGYLFLCREHMTAHNVPEMIVCDDFSFHKLAGVLTHGSTCESGNREALGEGMDHSLIEIGRTGERDETFACKNTQGGAHLGNSASCSTLSPGLPLIHSQKYNYLLTSLPDSLQTVYRPRLQSVHWYLLADIFSRAQCRESPPARPSSYRES